MGKAFKVQVRKKILTKRDCFLSSRYQGWAVSPAYTFRLESSLPFYCIHAIGPVFKKY